MMIIFGFTVFSKLVLYLFVNCLHLPTYNSNLMYENLIDRKPLSANEL